MAPSRRPTDQRGFTLVEVLVVILIIGILAAIALPAFLAQRAKAHDSEAITLVQTAQVALEALHLQSDSYDVTPAELVDEEVALGTARSLAVSGDDDTFEVSVGSATGTGFTIALVAGRRIERTCTEPGAGRCSSTGTW